MIDAIRPHDAHVHITRTSEDGRTGEVASTDAKMLVAAMDGAGVESAAVVVPRAMGWDNDPAFEALAEFPGRLVVIVKVDMEGRDAVGTLTRLLNCGARGIRLSVSDETRAYWIDDEIVGGVFGKLAERQGSLTVDCRPDQLGMIGSVAAAHPDLTIMIDHLGRPDVRTGPDSAEFSNFLDLARYPNVLAKSPNSAFFSAVRPPYLDLVPFVERAIERFGVGRFLWASDWPGQSYALALEPVATILAEGSACERYAVLRGNFERIFRQ